MRLPPARDGEEVKVRQRSAAFSYWPTVQGTTRERMQSTLFVTDPWFLIRTSLEVIVDPAAKSQALAYLNQSKDFYFAATHSDVSAAKPLLLYYAFLNLAKALVVQRSGAALGTVTHGLSEKLPTTAGAIHGNVSIQLNNPNSAFGLFAGVLGEQLPPPVGAATTILVRSQDFLSQILIGHRVYCQSENIKERFISLKCIQYIHNADSMELWLRMKLYADDISRLDYRQSNTVSALARSGVWRSVNGDEELDGRKLITLEQTQTTTYLQRPSQILLDASQAMTCALWRSVISVPPYRKYYLYIPTGTQTVMRQLLTIYIATYYFGSITRYKPESLNTILASSLGPFVQEFFVNQPPQFLYMMASEFSKNEVTKAAIVQ